MKERDPKQVALSELTRVVYREMEKLGVLSEQLVDRENASAESVKKALGDVVRTILTGQSYEALEVPFWEFQNPLIYHPGLPIKGRPYIEGELSMDGYVVSQEGWVVRIVGNEQQGIRSPIGASNQEYFEIGRDLLRIWEDLFSRGFQLVASGFKETTGMRIAKMERIQKAPAA